MKTKKETLLWLQWAQLQTRYDMRWMYRHLGRPVPKLDWEKDDSVAKKIEEQMDKEQGNKC